MPIQQTVRQRQSYRALSLGGAIVVMIGVATVATVDSYRAEREQQLTAARVLHDYALFASYTYSQNAFLYGQGRMLTAYAPLVAAGSLSRIQLPPETVLLPPEEKCGSGRQREPYRFRLDLPSRVLHVSRSGESGAGLWEQLDDPSAVRHIPVAAIGNGLRDRLRDTLALLATTPAIHQSGWGYAFVAGDGRRDAVSFRPQYDSSRHLIAVYGYESCYALIDQSDFATLYRDVQALPPTLVSSVPHDSLLFLEVTDKEGSVVYSGGIASQHTMYTGVTAVPQLGGLKFSVTIRPSLAPRLLIGGTPVWGAPRALALLVLTVMLGGLSMVLFRREARFARSREEFVTDVSHELRTPLQQILIFVQLLRLGRLSNEEERARSLAIIETETQRLIGLVASILGRARSESHKLRGRSVDMHEVIRNSIALFTPLAAARHVTIELSGENAVVISDPEALHQVLTSLLDNAVKYGPSGQVVRIQTVVLPESVSIHVDDQGPGIPFQDRRKAWEPFVRLGSHATRSSGGVGIGLAIVRDAVDRMSGTIVIEDAPGGGARLTLRLPRSVDPVLLSSSASNIKSFNLDHAIDSHR